MMGLSPEAARGLAVVQGIAEGIVRDFPCRDLVSFDRQLDAAMTAYAVHLGLGCGVAAALEAFDAPLRAASIATRLAGLSLAQSEAVRCVSRTLVWEAHFLAKARGAAPSETPPKPA